MATRDTLKEWFSTGKYPTEAQFAEWIDSYIHKDDELTINDIDGLEDELSDHTIDISDLKTATDTIYEDLQDLKVDVNKKQGTLTAGTGIAIEDNVISVTLDTTLYKVVTALPDEPEEDDKNKIFLLPTETTKTENIYTEYIYVEGEWEKIGEVSADLDLNDIYSKAEVDEKIGEKTDNITAIPTYEWSGWGYGTPYVNILFEGSEGFDIGRGRSFAIHFPTTTTTTTTTTYPLCIDKKEVVTTTKWGLGAGKVSSSDECYDYYSVRTSDVNELSAFWGDSANQGSGYTMYLTCLGDCYLWTNPPYVDNWQDYVFNFAYKWDTDEGLANTAFVVTGNGYYVNGIPTTSGANITSGNAYQSYCVTHARSTGLEPHINMIVPNGNDYRFDVYMNSTFPSVNLFYTFSDITMSHIQGHLNSISSGVVNVSSLYFTFCNQVMLSDISGLSNWNTASVTTMFNTFAYCSNLTNLSGIANWNTSSVTSMAYTFAYCSNLTNLSGIANWNTASVTTMSSTFWNCSNLTNLSGIANWNTASVTNMAYTFQSCSNLTLPNMFTNTWDMGKVTTIYRMFYDCPLTDTAIVHLPIRGNNVTNATNAFYYSGTRPYYVNVYTYNGTSTWNAIYNALGDTTDNSTLKVRLLAL